MTTATKAAGVVALVTTAALVVAIHTTAPVQHVAAPVAAVGVMGTVPAVPIYIDSTATSPSGSAGSATSNEVQKSADPAALTLKSTAAAAVLAAPASNVQPAATTTYALGAIICDADDQARAVRYALTPSYEYVDCYMVHRWKQQTKVGILDWLAADGHDSPLAQCDVLIDVDRQVLVGDKVLIYRRLDGKLGDVDELADFLNLPSYAMQTCASNCWFPATVLEQSIDGWLVSSYGAKVLVQIDVNSRVLDRQRWNAIWFDFHGERFQQTIDDTAVSQTIAFHVPCWRNRNAIVAFHAASIQRCIGGGRVVNEGPCK